MRRIGLLLVALICAVVALAFWQARDPLRDVSGGGFDLTAFFDGTSVSAGTITKVLVSTNAFTAAFTGERQGEAFRLEERFAFPDGERLQVWTLTSPANGRLEGTVETELEDGSMAAPVPVTGSSDETGIVLDYDGVAPGGGMRLHFRHHMRMQHDGTVQNRVVVKKFGLPLATSEVTFAQDAAALPSLVRGR